MKLSASNEYSNVNIELEISQILDKDFYQLSIKN